VVPFAPFLPFRACSCEYCSMNSSVYVGRDPGYCITTYTCALSLLHVDEQCTIVYHYPWITHICVSGILLHTSTRTVSAMSRDPYHSIPMYAGALSLLTIDEQCTNAYHYTRDGTHAIIQYTGR
jgi:hypothetical protein